MKSGIIPISLSVILCIINVLIVTKFSIFGKIPLFLTNIILISISVVFTLIVIFESLNVNLFESFGNNPRTNNIPTQLPTVYSKDMFYGYNQRSPGYIAGVDSKYTKSVL